MFPLARAASLRYKVLLLSLPPPHPPNPRLAAGNGDALCHFECHFRLFILMENFFFPLPFCLFFSWESPFSPKKVSSRKLWLKQGVGGAAQRLPQHKHTPQFPDLSSPPKQKLTRGIQLVNLTFGTLPAASSQAGELRSLLAEEERVKQRTVSEPIDYEPQTDIRETSGLHYALCRDAGPCSSQQAEKGCTMYMRHGL